MTRARVFTLEEANALVPTLQQLIGKQMARQSDVEERLRLLADKAGKLPKDLEVLPHDSLEVSNLKMDIAHRIQELEAGWSEVTGLGAVVKDPRTGLLDFYGEIDGRTVWLCWRYGEERVEHYHELTSGYSGRKPLDPIARQKLLN